LDVNKSFGEQAEKETEIPRQTIYSLPTLWKVQSGVSQVQNLPDLL
jgi:hypothetical protein